MQKKRSPTLREEKKKKGKDIFFSKFGNEKESNTALYRERERETSLHTL
jgi:hypothetical protein